MKAYKNKPEKPREPTKYSKNQELIWDSGAGFDVVEYHGQSSLFEGNIAKCLMKTGIKKGKVIPIDYNQLNRFSYKRWGEMRKRYTAS